MVSLRFSANRPCSAIAARCHGSASLLPMVRLVRHGPSETPPGTPRTLTQVSTTPSTSPETIVSRAFSQRRMMCGS